MRAPDSRRRRVWLCAARGAHHRSLHSSRCTGFLVHVSNKVLILDGGIR